jgi:hypothetical protein
MIVIYGGAAGQEQVIPASSSTSLMAILSVILRRAENCLVDALMGWWILFIVRKHVIGFMSKDSDQFRVE